MYVAGCTFLEHLYKGVTEKERKRKIDTALSVIIMIVVGTVFFSFNYYTPLFADDYSYSFSFATGERITSVSDIVTSMCSHYISMNGRLVTHFLAQLFLLIGKDAFNIINTVAFVAVGFLIYWHSGFLREVEKQNSIWLALIYILLYILPPAFGQSFLWVTGAANYLYGVLIVLLFLIPYRIYIRKEYHESNHSKIFFFCAASINFAFGTIAGATNENNSVALICMILLTMICTKLIYKRKIPAWMVTGLIGSVVGCACLLLSPGTVSRLSSAGGSGGIFTWIKRAILITFDAMEYLLPAIMLFVLVLTSYVMSSKTDSLKELLPIFTPMVIYLLGTLISIYSMAVSPQFPERAWSGPVIFFIIAIGNIIMEFDLSSCFRIWISTNLVCSILVICILGSCINTFYVLKNVEYEYDERVTSINAQMSDGSQEIYIPSISSDSKYSCFSYDGDLSEDPDVWPNTAIARYYGVDTIKILH